MLVPQQTVANNMQPTTVTVPIQQPIQPTIEQPVSAQPLIVTPPAPLGSPTTPPVAAPNLAPPDMIQNIIAQYADGTDKVKEFKSFPVDVYTDAAIISYQIADLPPGAKAKTNDPVPSVRFLFSNGEVRKWTRWFRMSYNEKSAIMQTFGACQNVQQLLADDRYIFNTKFSIFVKPKLGDKYTNIEWVKYAKDNEGVDQCFYDIEYIPHKIMRAFGQIIYLQLAVIKTKDGIITLRPENLLDGEYQKNKVDDGSNHGG